MPIREPLRTPGQLSATKGGMKTVDNCSLANVELRQASTCRYAAACNLSHLYRAAGATQEQPITYLIRRDTLSNLRTLPGNMLR
jgi:hypothetical protein